MLKNLKSLFIVEEEESKKPDPRARPKPGKEDAPAQAPEQAVHQAVKPQSQHGKTGQIQEKFMDILLKAMEDANLEGFDYLEYKRSMQSLSKMDMDEKTRYQSAFAMAQTMGATPAQLIDSAEHYVQALKKEEEKFENALNHQREKHISAKQQALQELTATIRKKEEQIKRLQAEIAQHREELSATDQAIKEATERVESTKNDFIASYNHLVGQISADIEKMKRHLK
jgi:chromosome segregation ATPase